MEFISAVQCFKPVDGCIRFVHTRVLFRQDGKTFCATSPNKRVGPQFCADELKDVKPIPIEAYRPLLPPGVAIAPPTLDYYVKQPNLMSFVGGVDLASLVLQELATCEIIRKKPHPNLATFYGCQIDDGRVSGLCFERYTRNLMQEVNPNSLSKSAFIQSEGTAASRKISAGHLRGIEAGLRRLHALGIIHNDLNPTNIMIAADGRAVLVDYDSSRAPEMPLDNAKRTHGWHDPCVNTSQESNDWDALRELRIWLTGSSPDEFQFKE